MAWHLRVHDLISVGHFDSLLLRNLGEKVRPELLSYDFACTLTKVIIVENLQKVFERQHFNVYLINAGLHLIHLECLQKSLYEVYVSGKAKTDELLRELFSCKIAFLVQIPSFENLLGELHVFDFFNHLHASVLMLFDPSFHVASDKQLRFVHSIKGLLLVLIVDVAENFEQAGFRDLRTSALVQSLLLSHVQIDLFQTFSLLLYLVYEEGFLLKGVGNLLLLGRIIASVNTVLGKLVSHVHEMLRAVLL